MTPAETVGMIVELHEGKDLKLGDYVLRLPGGGELDFTTKQVNGDLIVEFMGKRPLASYFVFNLSIKRLIICIKGVRVDAVALPERVDPFIPWEKIAEALR